MVFVIIYFTIDCSSFVKIVFSKVWSFLMFPFCLMRSIYFVILKRSFCFNANSTSGVNYTFVQKIVLKTTPLQRQRVVILSHSRYVKLRRSRKRCTVVIVKIVKFIVSLFLLPNLCSWLYYFLRSKSWADCHFISLQDFNSPLVYSRFYSFLRVFGEDGSASSYFFIVIIICTFKDIIIFLNFILHKLRSNTSWN